MKGLIFTYLLTYGGAVASLFNPYVGLLVYVCFAIIKPEALWFWSVPQGNYSRIVAIALLVGWALNGFGNWRFGRARALVYAFVGFWIWMVVTTAHTPRGEPAWDFAENIGKVVLPFVVGVTLIDSIAKVKQLVWVIALSQGYVAFEFNLSYVQGANTLQEYGFAGMDNNSVAIALVACAGLSFFLGLYARRWYLKLLAFACAGASAHAVMFSFSRGGLMGLIITGIAAFFLIPKRPKHYLVFALAIAIGFQLAGAEVRQRFLSAFVDKSQRDESAQERLDYWGYCWDIMRSEPVFGIGPRQFPEEMPIRYGRKPLEAHSLWLQTGAEMGFPGMALLVSFYGLCLLGMWQLARHSSVGADPAFNYLARMVMASLIGFAVSAQFVSLYGLELPYYIVLIGAGLLKLNSNLSADSPPSPPSLTGTQREGPDQESLVHAGLSYPPGKFADA